MLILSLPTHQWRSLNSCDRPSPPFHSITLESNSFLAIFCFVPNWIWNGVGVLFTKLFWQHREKTFYANRCNHSFCRGDTSVPLALLSMLQDSYYCSVTYTAMLNTIQEEGNVEEESPADGEDQPSAQKQKVFDSSCSIALLVLGHTRTVLGFL